LHALDVWRTYADVFESEILIRQGRPLDGIVQLHQAIRSLEASGFVLYNTAFEGVLAEGLMTCGRHDEADTIVSKRPRALSTFGRGMVRARAHACARSEPG